MGGVDDQKTMGPGGPTTGHIGDEGHSGDAPRRRRWGLYGAIGLIPLLGVLALVWIASSLGPAPEAEWALVPGAGVDVTQQTFGLVFSPTSVEPTTGVIFYPGGKVDYRSYAALAREMVEARDVVVVIVPMTLDLAVLSEDRADQVIEAMPEIESWVIAGHSLGGMAACSYLSEHAESGKDDVRGLVLLASYPPEGVDLSGIAEEGVEAVVSVTASNDLVLDAEAFESARERLPEDTVYVEIEGGNHSQFGSYGQQPGDGAATISAQEQRAAVIEAIGLALDAAAG